MRSLAILSEKGGTGKTTTTLNLAAGLALAGERVLVIDADPQANATLVLTRDQPLARPTLGEVLMGKATPAEAIGETHWPGVDLLPASAELADVNVLLPGMIARESRLRKALESVQGYGTILFDCSPQRTLININVLNAAAEVLVPVDPSLFSWVGLGQIREAVELVRHNLENRALKIVGLVLTRVRKDNVCRVTEETLRREAGRLVYASAIPHNVKVEEAHSRWQSVLTYAPRSPGAKAYLALTEEVRHGQGHGARNTDEPAGGGTLQIYHPEDPPAGGDPSAGTSAAAGSDPARAA